MLKATDLDPCATFSILGGGRGSLHTNDVLEAMHHGAGTNSSLGELFFSVCVDKTRTSCWDSRRSYLAPELSADPLKAAE